MNAYIKAQKSLRTSPKILRIATLLGILPRMAMGLVIGTWMFADDYADAENRVYGIDKDTIDTDAGMLGFGDALEAVGWIECGKGWVEFPFYLEKNDTSEQMRKQRREKTREQNRERQRRRRERIRNEKDNSHNNGQDESENVTRDRCVTGALHVRDNSVTGALHPNGHYKGINTNTETNTQQGVTTDQFKLSNEGLAQEWCFRCKRKKHRRCQDDVFDITDEISALTDDLGIPPQLILDHLKAKRDTSEYFWQFKKRIIDAHQQANQPAHKIESWDEKKARLIAADEEFARRQEEQNSA